LSFGGKYFTLEYDPKKSKLPFFTGTGTLAEVFQVHGSILQRYIKLRLHGGKSLCEDKDEIFNETPMKSTGWMILIFLIMLFFTGCIFNNRNYDITVSSLDPGGFLQDAVGNFDVYTGNFRVTNPTNITFDNVDVDITLSPTTSYCHGLTKTFSIPRFSPHEKRTLRISIAEFGNLDCQYNYSYQVFTRNTNTI